MACTTYLHECLALHGEVTAARFGKTQRLDAVERNVQALVPKRQFDYDVIRALRDSALWDAEMFGYWPSEEDFAATADGKDWSGLWRLPKGEGGVVTQLLRVFQRQLEQVSVLLRFWQPKDYGIISPPVDTVLGIAPQRQRWKRYSRYLKCLRELRDERGFDTAAHVEMALWALQVGVVDGGLRDVLPGSELARLRGHFDRDDGLKSLRIANLTQQVLEETPALDLAAAIAPIDKRYAARIAAVEFEQMLRRWLRADRNEDLVEIIGRAPTECRARLHAARRVRNDAVHGTSLRTDQVRRLIETARWVAERLPE